MSKPVAVFESNVYYSYNFSAQWTGPNIQFTLNSTYLDGGLNSQTISYEWCTMDKAIVEYEVFINGSTIQAISLKDYLPSDKTYVPHLCPSLKSEY